MNCSGRNAFTGLPIEIEFGEIIDSVSSTESSPEDYIAPGFIDIQVNGFAGVDYNQPNAPHSEIARSIHALFATGVTRFYPTVITGAPADMESALHNLSRAKDSLPEGDAIDGF